MKIKIENTKKLIREEKFLISKHARIRMFQRNISTNDIKEILLNGEIIEEYLDDQPCPSVLILSFLNNLPYHIVVAECEDHIRIITIYRPDEDKWRSYKIRR